MTWIKRSPPNWPNISTRGFVGTETDVMIGGFILGGGKDVSVVVRAQGLRSPHSESPVRGPIPTLELHYANGQTRVPESIWQRFFNSDTSCVGVGGATGVRWWRLTRSTDRPKKLGFFPV